MALEKPHTEIILKELKRFIPKRNAERQKRRDVLRIEQKNSIRVFGFNKGYISVAKLAREMS